MCQFRLFADQPAVTDSLCCHTQAALKQTQALQHLAPRARKSAPAPATTVVSSICVVSSCMTCPIPVRSTSASNAASSFSETRVVSVSCTAVAGVGSCAAHASLVALPVPAVPLLRVAIHKLSSDFQFCVSPLDTVAFNISAIAGIHAERTLCILIYFCEHGMILHRARSSVRVVKCLKHIRGKVHSWDKNIVGRIHQHWLELNFCRSSQPEV